MKVQNKHTISEKIIMYRKRAELSQMDLEIEAGLGFGAINKIEKGKNSPTLKTLHKIAIALRLEGKDTAYLLNVNLYKIKNKKHKSPC